jgi:hypothetical protein
LTAKASRAETQVRDLDDQPGEGVGFSSAGAVFVDDGS